MVPITSNGWPARIALRLMLLACAAVCVAGCGSDEVVGTGSTPDSGASDGAIALPDGFSWDDSGHVLDPDGQIVDLDGKMFADDGAIVPLDGFGTPDSGSAICESDADCTGLAPCLVFVCDQTSHQCIQKAFGHGPCTIGPASCGLNGFCIYGRCAADSPICVGTAACCASCQLDAECNDGAECTEDICNPSSKTCGYSLLKACSMKCVADADCDDGEAGTVDSCVASVCQHVATVPLAPFCPDMMHCSDGKACSGGACNAGSGACTWAPASQCDDFACQTNVGGVCDDGNPCTNDLCGDDGKCHHLTTSACGPPPCQTDDDCDDHNVCTADSCSLGASTMKTCFHSADTGITGCCKGAGDCDDGVACTVDSCVAGNRCQHKADSTCECETAADCGTFYGDPCRFPGCVQGKCILAPIPNCECKGVGLSVDPCDDQNPCTDTACYAGKCLAFAANCNDNDPCTMDVCNAKGCVHAPVPGCLQKSCTATGDCLDADLCTEDYCVHGICKRVPRYCDDGHGCTADSCSPQTGACVHAPIPDCSGFGG